MAHDALEVHANIVLVDLLFRTTQINAATHICALPRNHPLHPLAVHAAKCLVNHYRTPLHYLFYTTQLNPKLTEIIMPLC